MEVKPSVPGMNALGVGAKWLLGLSLATVLVLLPWVFSNPFQMSIIIMALLYAYLALSWNIIGGLGGQLSLGHSAYAGIGAFTSTILFVRYGWSPWIGMWAGALLSAVAAVMIGLPTFRLRGAYFALATLAATMMLKIVAENTHHLTGGPRGMEVTLLKDAPLFFQHTNKLFYYIIILAMCVLVVLTTLWIMRAKIGYYLKAIKNDQEAAQSLGINITRYKLIANVLSAIFTSLGGTFYAQFVLYINPEKILGVNLSVQLAIMCIIGGRGTVMGPILGAILLVASEEITRHLFGSKLIGANLMIYGMILMVVIRYKPQGFYTALQEYLSRKRILSS
jgi:branched-chain amino acid transport system permease protein